MFRVVRRDDHIVVVRTATREGVPPPHLESCPRASLPPLQLDLGSFSNGAIAVMIDSSPIVDVVVSSIASLSRNKCKYFEQRKLPKPRLSCCTKNHITAPSIIYL